MAIFKGEATDKPTPRIHGLTDYATKLVRANPKFIRHSGEVCEYSRSDAMNEWDLEQDPTDARFRCYRLRVFQEQQYIQGKFVLCHDRWVVVASLNINDSLRRIFPTSTAAMSVFDAIHDYTTKKKLRTLGFRTW